MNDNHPRRAAAKSQIIDETDRLILNRIQSDFPVSPRPFLAIAEHLGLEEKEVIKRLKRLKKDGIIRRIGGNFAPEKLGFVSTLCAAKVPPGKIDQFARAVNRFSGVTHNYERDNPFNIWFTFIAPDRETIDESLAQIMRQTGVTTILNLPATRVFKIRAQFNL